MDNEVNLSLTEQVNSLQQQLAEATQDHEKGISELVDEAEDLRYWLSRTRSTFNDETKKVTELRIQLADIRRMIMDIAARLESRGKYVGTGSLEDQLAGAQGFICAVSDELRDGINETIQLFRDRNPVDD
ncbi:hypothetical protein C8F04DRAFT_1248465 [Mycena alexandri]|uniref:Uncharacterized protein n=1 Tax=Mycena alexandri TaxID=1745969 RepID=A0AAD6WNZ8_9AGAR|nr:hypothetical protein C8F04DRAFT_1275903 [Mycena alexandri]KAJ7023350.1 hypothetical protein C8F04DRAFT_1271414 [Mycena alexandri]KAJ7046209.1 hypothetical protein C8F04DRAFT_1248465 [Mycena alexandri]